MKILLLITVLAAANTYASEEPIISHSISNDGKTSIYQESGKGGLRCYKWRTTGCLSCHRTLSKNNQKNVSVEVEEPETGWSYYKLKDKYKNQQAMKAAAMLHQNKL